MHPKRHPLYWSTWVSHVIRKTGNLAFSDYPTIIVSLDARPQLVRLGTPSGYFSDEMLRSLTEGEQEGEDYSRDGGVRRGTANQMF